MERIIRFSGYKIISDEELDELKKLADDESTRHLHIEVSEPFEYTEDLPIAEKNCDLEHLENYFPIEKPEDNGRTIEIGRSYKHFKGKTVVVTDVVQDSENPNKRYVTYICNNGKHFARSLEMFLSEVDHAKYPDVTQKYRFELIG